MVELSLERENICGITKGRGISVVRILRFRVIQSFYALSYTRFELFFVIKKNFLNVVTGLDMNYEKFGTF